MSFGVRSTRWLMAILAAMLLSAAPTALAQNPPNWIGGGPAAVPPSELKDVTVVEHAGDMLPLDLPLADELGRPVKLGDFFGGNKPVILQMGYFKCPMLCGLVSQGMVDSMKDITLLPGKDFEFVYVSIDPSEKPELANQKKAGFVGAYGKPESAAGLHLLTASPASIARLTQVTGFGYKWVASAGQYAHPAVIVLGMPGGKISRYLYGVRFDPQTLRLSLVEASEGKIGTTKDAFLLTCFQYDGKQGKYAMTALTIMRTGGVLMILIVGTALTIMFRREWREESKRRAEEQGGNGQGTRTGVFPVARQEPSSR